MPLPVPARRPAAVAALVAALLLVGAVLAAPVGAKEFLQARLDAPIAFDSPPGAVLLVGAVVEAMSPDGLVPAEGQPVYLVLTGRDGTTTRAAGAGDRRPAGHYTFEIVVPPGGVRDAEIGLHGSSDLPMHVGRRPVHVPADVGRHRAARTRPAWRRRRPARARRPGPGPGRGRDRPVTRRHPSRRGPRSPRWSPGSRRSGWRSWPSSSSGDPAAPRPGAPPTAHRAPEPSRARRRTRATTRPRSSGRWSSAPRPATTTPTGSS